MNKLNLLHFSSEIKSGHLWHMCVVHTTVIYCGLAQCEPKDTVIMIWQVHSHTKEAK